MISVRTPHLVQVRLTNVILSVVVVFSHLSPSNAYTFDGSYKISPKPCTVDTRTGTCMFVWECLKTEGKHLGMCVDGFMFGSCCGHNTSSNFVLEHNSFTSTSTSSTTTTTTTSTTLPTTTSTTTTTTTQHNNNVPYETAIYTKFSTTFRPWRTTTTTTTEPTPTTTSTSFFEEPTTIPTSTSTTTTTSSTRKPVLTVVQSSSTVEHELPFVTGNGSSIPEQLLSSTILSSTSHHHHTYHSSNKPSTAALIGNKPPIYTKTTTTTTAKPTSTSTTTTTTTTTEPSTSTTRRTSTKSPPLFPTNSNNKNTARPTTIFIDPRSTTTPQPNITLDRDYGCGVAPIYPQMRIVGGKAASFGAFPWQVSVRRTSFFGFSSTHRCGGALLNENWIATAGHCVDDLMTSQIRIRLGEWDFSGTSEKYPHVERGVAKKVVHPSYNFFTYEHDLALIKLETPVILTPHINPICLPGNDDLLINENATVSGWGRLSEGGQLPSILQHVTVPILSNAKCREMFLKSGRVEHIPDIFLCAGFENGGRDSCQGDSGGPLQVRGSDNRWFLAGIISWGIGCAEPNMPGVCTRISKFTSWILKHVTA